MTSKGWAAAAAVLLAAGPTAAQTVGPCPRGSPVEANTPWVLFDLGSAVLRPEAKPIIADAAAKAKARQAVNVCLLGQTDKLGNKEANARLAQARSQAVANEMIRQGYPAKNIIIAVNPEAFGDLSFGSKDASEKDRRVSILFR